MTNKKTTKRALIASVISLMLCFTMLLGTTYAWFTDSVTSTNNIIKSGNLDIELYYQKTGETGWTQVTDKTNVFEENALWEPGHTEVVKLKVVNEGSLALKYRLGVNIANEVGSVNVNGNAFKLSDFIKFGIVESDADYTRETAIAAVETTATALNKAYTSDVTKLPVNDEKIVTMVVYMPTTVDNEANYAKGEAIPTIDLGINLFATQDTAENDSFDDQYDVDATYPINVSVSKPVSVDASNKSTEQVTITYEDETASVSDIEVTVPEGTQLEAGTTDLVLKIEEKADVNADVATQITSNQTATTYEISLEGISASNYKDIEVTLFIEKGLVDVVLYHKGAIIPCSYDATTGELSFTTKSFSPFTVVSAIKLFESGNGTAEDPYIINKASDLYNVSKYYHEYKYFKVADGVETLDLNGIGNLSLYGSFDGNGVKIVNLTTSLFQEVGRIDAAQEIKISNMDVTVHITNGRALVKNIYNAGNTVFENVSVHGYIEGQYNMGSFYNYGTANHGSSNGSDYTVSFVNAKSDATLVCTTGNAIGGMLGHGYQGSGYVLSVNMDENSGYTGKMYTTGTATCFQVMALCSSSTYMLNGVETSRTANTYPSTKLTVATPTAGADGWYVAPTEGVDHYVVYLNAQITAYDENGDKIVNKAGMTGNLGNHTVSEGFDGKLFDLVTSAVIVNGTDHDYSYEIKDGALTVYTGRSDNYASGWITLQVNQYDADGNLLATGIVRVYTFSDPVVVSTADELKTSLEKGGNVILVGDIDLGETQITVPAGVNAILNLNGHNVDAVQNGTTTYGTFNVAAGAALTLKGEGKVTLKTNVTSGISACIFQNDGILNIYGGSYEANQAASVKGLNAIIAVIDNCPYNSDAVTNIYGGEFAVTGLGAINIIRNWPIHNDGTATLNIYGGNFKANAEVPTTYIWNHGTAASKGYINFYGGTYDTNVVYEDYYGQTDIYVADGVVITPCPDNN